MVIHLHASCWNEARLLPFFFRHYDPFIDHYFIHDNQSDDGSEEILNGHPNVTVVPLHLEGDSIIEAAFAQVNGFWLPSRGQADWVAVCNIDEFFWHPDMKGYLSNCQAQGVTCINSFGFQMISEKFPGKDDNLADSLRTGVRDSDYDKPSFFNPDKVSESGFNMARHGWRPTGTVNWPSQAEIFLLHYKHLGQDYLVERHTKLNARRRSRDIERKYGFHYDPRLTIERHVSLLAEAQDVITPQGLPVSPPEALEATKKKTTVPKGRLSKLFKKFKGSR